jgi:hypothetical protein
MDVDEVSPTKEELEEAELLLGVESGDGGAAKFEETVAAFKRKQAAVDQVRKRQVLRHGVGGGANFIDAANSSAAAAAAFGDPLLIQEHSAQQVKAEAKRAFEASAAAARPGALAASGSTSAAPVLATPGG